MIIREPAFNVQVLNSFRLNLDIRIAGTFIYLLNKEERTILEYIQFGNIQIEFYKNASSIVHNFYKETYEQILEHRNILVSDLNKIKEIIGGFLLEL